MNIKSADFITSAKNFPDVLAQIKLGKINILPQVAFVGRSNVGKSSLINMLCNRKNMAITSSTPGRTRLINFFYIKFVDNNNNGANSEMYFVDLPGYGFATATKGEQSDWNAGVGGYLTGERQIKCIFVILDIRLKPSDKDIMCLNFLQANGIPFAILGSKADKLSKAEVGRAVSKLASELGVGVGDIIATSSKDKTGRDKVLNKILSIL